MPAGAPNVTYLQHVDLLLLEPCRVLYVDSWDAVVAIHQLGKADLQQLERPSPFCDDQLVTLCPPTEAGDAPLQRLVRSTEDARSSASGGPIGDEEDECGRGRLLDNGTDRLEDLLLSQGGVSHLSSDSPELKLPIGETPSEFSRRMAPMGSLCKGSTSTSWEARGANRSGAGTGRGGREGEGH